ncbi:MAG: aspartate/glutamate racemase family protein [Hyphomicrobiaceae bacterium]|nr:aspartate/glutamate racemase family protein [Hyphomicrobiaceae bacterium]
MEPELYGLDLQGVSFHGVRLRTDDRPRMPEDAIELAPVFKHLGVNAVVYACAATSFLQGVDANEVIARRLEDVCGVPALTATGAMLNMLAANGSRRIALATPYAPVRGDVLADFLRRKGFDVVNIVHEEMSLFVTNLQHPEFAYRLGRRADHAQADTVLISGTNLRTLEIIDALQRDSGKIVVTSNQAILWNLGQRLGIALDRPYLERPLPQTSDRVTTE